jgi:hypothetical protein
MAQDLTVNIKTTSDVPQAMDKATQATSNFGRQVQDIQKKFGNAFKDIFLGFTAPMILIQSAISYISAAMEKARQDAKEGLDLIAQGKTEFANSQEARTAAFFKRRKELEEEKRLVAEGRASITEQILTDPELGKGFVPPQRIMQRLQSGESIKGVSKDPELGRMAMDFLQQTEKGRKILAESTPAEASRGSTSFKGPEGFSNVVGVGSNPVMEAMTAQLEEQRKQTALLQQIASPNGSIPADFTKSTSPSRAALLKGAL